MAKRRQNSVTVLAPAKLNLTLDVTGIAPNGYHMLDMLMQAVSLYETVEVRKSRGLTLKLPNSTVPVNDSNTAIKAALAFFNETGLLAGAAITIHKKIPVRAGMAGGSADAAAVLVGLNELYRAKLTTKQLCDIGVKIGADVPFSIIGGTMRVTGIGDILTPCAPCPRCFITVCMPKNGISTPKAFARFDEIGTDIKVDTQAAVTAAENGDLYAMCKSMKNALQYSSESKANAPICEIMTKNGALAALMTGSGAAVFGVFETEEKARTAQAALLEKYPQAWVVMPVKHGTHVVNF
jgi:4-diphosphocytidyl-2-C-methyl-D-erythritol kinase